MAQAVHFIPKTFSLLHLGVTFAFLFSCDTWFYLTLRGGCEKQEEKLLHISKTLKVKRNVPVLSCKWVFFLVHRKLTMKWVCTVAAE